MSIRLHLSVADYTVAELRLAAVALGDTLALHARVAADAERWIKGPKVAGRISGSQHRSAQTLGATPTGHLTKAYQDIEGQSDATGASLLVPASSRLAAAFGPVTVKPKKPDGYLTLAAHREAYGKRAREFPEGELFPVRVGPRKTLTLSRSRGEGRLEVMYVLVREATIPEDPALIPFEELGEVARLAVGDYIDDTLETQSTT